MRENINMIIKVLVFDVIMRYNITVNFVYLVFVVFIFLVLEKWFYSFLDFLQYKIYIYI